jgi:hypothetical protein
MRSSDIESFSRALWLWRDWVEAIGRASYPTVDLQSVSAAGALLASLLAIS